MASPITQNKSYVSESEQKILKKSRDDKYDVLAVMLLGEDGDTARRIKVDSSGVLAAGDYAVKVVTDGTDTYVCSAIPGSLVSESKWQIYKVDSSSGVVVTYADGDASFDNVATDPTALDFS